MSKSWRCFHCDRLYRDPEAAADHFGVDESRTPACRLAARDGGLVGLVREQEEELRRFRLEETASYREFYALGAKHARELRSADEQGYARALLDVQGGSVERSFALKILPVLQAVAGLGDA